MHRVDEKPLLKQVNPDLVGLKPDFELHAIEPMISDTFVHYLISQRVILKDAIESFTETEVVFKTGEKIAIDAIIFCTNSELKFAFFEDQSIVEQIIDPKNNQIALYKNQYPKNLRNPGSLAFIGLVQPYGPLWVTIELQTRLAARVITGLTKLPNKKAIENDIKKAQKEVIATYDAAQKGRTCLHLNWIPFNDSLADLIGCRPKMAKYFFTDHKLYRQLNFGHLSAAQYRLEGPDKWAQARENCMTIDKRYKDTMMTC